MGQDIPINIPPATAIFTTQTDPIWKERGDDEKSPSLKGNKPNEFDRLRKDSETFLDDFNVYWKINRKNETMKEPYSRVLMAISFMKGPKVRDWTRAQVKDLDDKIDIQGIDPNNETLWKEFKKSFLRAFTDTTSRQDAYAKLKTLKMEGDDLDTYIATHENLV
jgi:hypothetical protein